MEGNFSTDKLCFVLTHQTLDRFKDDPHYFFADKEQDFINTIISGIQAKLRTAFNYDKPKNMLGSLTITLTTAYFGNPINYLVRDLESLKQKKWASPLMALLAIDQLLQSQIHKDHVGKYFQESLDYIHKDMLQFIAQVKHHAIDKVMYVLGTYSIYERIYQPFANPNQKTTNYRP